MSCNPGPTVDIHAHVATPACDELVSELLSSQRDPFSFYSTPETNQYNTAQFTAVAQKLVDPELRLADMDSMGVDIQALSVAPPQFYYWTDPELGHRLAHLQNEHIAEIVQAHPNRFVGLASVPLQDVSAATTELEYCVRDLDFRGAAISTNINGLDLDNRRFRPFFAKAQELDVVVLLHPHGFTHGERLIEYYLNNVVGNPLDSAVALTRIICGGVLEDFPHLKLCVVHGGGYGIFSSSRLDHAYSRRPEPGHHITRAPSTYLSQVYVDSVVYNPSHLGFLVGQLGADHVMIGTDYPYDMGHYAPVDFLNSVAGLDAGERNRIRSEVATGLLKI